MSASPFVSVIIPVFNDSARLFQCLKALENQTYSQELHEIIVVDNGSDEDIKELSKVFSHVTFTDEARTGSYAARNRGISLAKGDVIAFTDADCIPDSSWIEKGVQALNHASNCGMVAGKINLFFKNPDHPTLVEMYDSVMAFHQKKFISKLRYGATANVFTFKSVIQEVGTFNEALKSNGDREWGQRVYRAGYEQVYGEDACVAHPARRTFSELYKRTIRITGGHYDYKKRRGYSWKEFIRDWAMDVFPSWQEYQRIWAHSALDWFQRFQLTLVMIVVKHLSARERLRLQFGGTSTRG
ncbi:MAG: glycosyltransferase [Cyanobacteria bacterium P01_E01_bin.6]